MIITSRAARALTFLVNNPKPQQGGLTVATVRQRDQPRASLDAVKLSLVYCTDTLTIDRTSTLTSARTVSAARENPALYNRT